MGKVLKRTGLSKLTALISLGLWNFHVALSTFNTFLLCFTFQMKEREKKKLQQRPIFFPSSHYPPDIKCYRQCRTKEQRNERTSECGFGLGAISHWRKLRVTDTDQRGAADGRHGRLFPPSSVCGNRQERHSMAGIKVETYLGIIL